MILKFRDLRRLFSKNPKDNHNFRKKIAPN